jgi:transcriptional regulator with XRE-family HTH domain
MEIKQKLGKRIRELRNKKNITQEFIAEKINISPANYSRIENGISYPKPENIEKICEILEVTAKDLFDFENHKNINDIIQEICSEIKNNDSLARLLYKFMKTVQ